MDVREKLVELLLQEDGLCKLDECKDCNANGSCYYYRAADRIIAHGVTVQEWIPVTERLPKNYEAVLTFDGRSIHIMAHHHDFKDPFGIAKGNFMGYAPITHWMPLPEPPKGDNNG